MNMKHQRVAVIRGGPSEEYDISMQTGSAVISALRDLGYTYKDIVVTRSGDWLDSGIVRNPEVSLEAVDVVFVALHGKYGEDGQVQKILQRKNIPFTGSGSLASGIAFNKDLTKRTLKPHGVLMPEHTKVSREILRSVKSKVDELIEDIGAELILKPVTSGSSHGTRFATNSESLSLALQELLGRYDEVLVEEYIRGKEATVGVLADFRNQSMYALPVVEIIPPSGEPVFSYINKYNGKSKEICPGRFSYKEKAKLTEVATLAHTAINCNHYSRSDFIVRDGEVYFLEINTLPGLTSESLLPKAAAEIGLSFKQLVEHLVETARV